MKHLPSVLSLSLLLAAGPVLAAGAEPDTGVQTASSSTDSAARSALDLSLPKQADDGALADAAAKPFDATATDDRAPATAATAAIGEYAPAYIADPPGTYYGDRSGRATPSSGVLTHEAAACDGQLHGSVSMGMGYSRRGGNSNWQATQLNTCKRYVTDSGKERQVGLSISVGQGSGPGYWGGYGGGYGGPGDYYGPEAGYYDGRYDSRYPGHYDGFGGPGPGPGWRGTPSPVW